MYCAEHIPYSGDTTYRFWTCNKVCNPLCVTTTPDDADREARSSVGMDTGENCYNCVKYCVDKTASLEDYLTDIGGVGYLDEGLMFAEAFAWCVRQINPMCTFLWE